MAKTRYPQEFRIQRAVIARYGLTEFEVQWPPRRIQTRPTGGAYVGIGWLIRGRGQRVNGWTITSRPEAIPRVEYLEGEFVILDGTF